MKRRSQGVRRTAHKSSPDRVTNALLFFIAIILDSLINIGSGCLWALKETAKASILFENKINQEQEKIKRLLKKRKKKLNKKIADIILRSANRLRILFSHTREILRHTQNDIKTKLVLVTKKIRLKPILRKKPF